MERCTSGKEGQGQEQEESGQVCNRGDSCFGVGSGGGCRMGLIACYRVERFFGMSDVVSFACCRSLPRVESSPDKTG